MTVLEYTISFRDLGHVDARYARLASGGAVPLRNALLDAGLRGLLAHPGEAGVPAEVLLHLFCLAGREWLSDSCRVWKRHCCKM